jgi:hypothetical protein
MRKNEKEEHVFDLNRLGVRPFVSACLGAMVLLCPEPALEQGLKVSPEVAAELAKSPPPPLSNQVTGVGIDRFIGNPLLSPVQVFQSTILVRSILRHGDPYHAGERGAVLQYRKDLQYGTMLAHNRTPLASIPEQLLLYCEDGNATVDDGERYWDLKDGIAALIPPKLAFRIVNTGEEPIHLLILTWSPQPGAKPGPGIVVRDVNAMPYTMCGGQICHWSYFGKNVFNSAHGLSPQESFHVVYVPPMSIGEPHAHIAGWEEVWTKLPPNDAYLTLGSEVRAMPANTAFLAPPNNQTVHAVQNLKTDAVQAWFFIGTFAFDQPDYGRDPLVPPKHLGSQ